MTERYRFDRNELAGALGDLGALLPIAPWPWCCSTA